MMKNKKDRNFDKSRRFRKHPIGQRLVIGLLCVCLLVMLLPMEFYGYLALAAQKQEIVMFSMLPREVGRQMVPAGTELEELNLPHTLEAVCRPLEDSSPEEENAPEETEPFVMPEETEPSAMPEETEPSAMPEGTELSAMPEGTESSAMPEEMELEAEPEGKVLSEEEMEPSDISEEIGLTAEPEDAVPSETGIEQTLTIEGVVWTSEPEYDKEAEGSYVFTPVLPEAYSLAAGVELPEITVSVMQDSKTDEEENLNQDRDKRKTGNKTAESVELFAEAEGEPLPGTPGCGTISQNTVWTVAGTLANGELIVEEGVTLTINAALTISGNVTIKGGGTIARGNNAGSFSVGSGAGLTLENITLDGKSVPASVPMINVTSRGMVTLNNGSKIQNCRYSNYGGAIANSSGTVVLNGAVIQNCKASSGGAIYNTSSGSVTIEYAVIENCTASSLGGGIMQDGGAKVIIKDGRFSNNKTTSSNAEGWTGGGFMCLCRSTLEIYGGEFTENTTGTCGGCIHHCGCPGTTTDIKGGYFSGNTSTNDKYKGSGAIYNSTKYEGVTSMTLSGKVQFCGDGEPTSGTDGVYLDHKSTAGIFRKIKISDTLLYPVTLYLEAQEGRVIAEGTNNYVLLHERDMKKIKFVDVGDSGKTWYAELDKEHNEVKVTETAPEYMNKFYVYYNSNGAEGTVVDDANEGAGYDIGAPAVVQPADELRLEGYVFVEWNTRADGEGDSYAPGDNLIIQGDTDLYAIFEKEITLAADFYSGSTGQKETRSDIAKESVGSVKIKAPDLAAFAGEEGFSPVGWSADPAGFTGNIAPDDEIILTENKEYYGIYEKDVTLTYDARGAEGEPDAVTRTRRASVQKEQTAYAPAQFSIAPGPVRPGSIFAGWNTQADGKGTFYHEGVDILKTQEDITLYAIFDKTLTVNFYSGSQGNIETKTAIITGDNISGTVETPELEEMEGWTRMGWSTDTSGYEREVQAGTALTLTENADYYGIYEKDVTLSYEGEEGNGTDTRETKLCRANVHSTITCDKPAFTLRPAPVRKGYIFQGWSTQPDGRSEADGRVALYPPESRQEFDRDTTLYPSWKADNASYRVEHHLQEIEGEGYVLEAAETEELFGIVGETVEAAAKEIPGFTENLEHSLRYASGKVEADGSLVLKFFYDRNVYDVDFDLNGGFGKVPEPQSVRYGGLLQTVDAPERTGYNFKGWYLDKAGSQGKQWDFAKTVDKNTDAESVTLYAKWVDETAPVLEKASYEKGHKSLFGWILRKDRLKITVPLTEEGSGVKQAEYILIPEKTAEGKKTAQGVNICTPVYGAIGLPLGAVNAGGTISRTTKGRARLVTRNDEVVAEFTISEDFKGTVVMTASDWAGNVSAEKMLTSEGGGVIVEDNAPDIRFTSDKKGQYDNVFEIGVEIRDDADENISGGIAGVSYQIDGGKEISLPQKAFREGIVESYWFTMKITGAGSHTLRVKAVDNAGNSSSRKINVDICGKNTPPGPEPKTGDTSHVEIYATASMIAGFSYLLLYFRDHGMTEEKKEELVSRLVEWARGKGGIRRMLALMAIFLVLAYYHSIGKSVPEECLCLCKKI